jgi:UPF0755 protein
MPKRRLHRRAVLGVALIGLLAGCTAPEPPDVVWVTVPSAPVEAVAESLAAYEIVGSAKAFARFARMGRKHLGIKEGTYPLTPGTPMGAVLVVLRKGRPLARRLAVSPGIWLTELAVEVEQTLGIPADRVRAVAGDSGLRSRARTRGETLEGYLYPTVYYVPVGASAHDLVRQMVDTFEARWSPDWDARLDTMGLSRDELVTLASIIEGEDPHDADRLHVSSVYHNRLAEGQRLQADPTVVYALGQRRRLRFADYGTRSDYNTYRIGGLPPTPIGQPSGASLEAALYPAATEFRYFVARPDGRHVFTRSYREHLSAIRGARRPMPSQNSSR